MPNKIKRDVELLYEVGCLRNVMRTWKHFLNPDVQNVAEHSFRVAWIALTLAKYEGKGSHEKIMKLALLHDLTESRTGDVNYISRQYVKRDEELAVRDIFFDTVHEKEMIDLLKEYEERKSIESRIVKDADNIDVDMELQEMHAKGCSLGRIWKKKREELVYPEFFTKSAQKFWKSVYASDPHDWHNVSARNRFESGDWKKK
ncbi:MAG: HD domain-containing protein [bacterium]